VSFGNAATFAYLTLADPSSGTICIDEISVANLNLLPGMYLVTLNLDDGKDIARIPFALVVMALPVDPTAVTVAPDPTTTIDNSTDTTIIDPMIGLLDPSNPELTAEQIAEVQAAAQL
jgi:hypothetical protein